MNLFGFSITRSQRSTTPPLQRSLSPEAAAWLAGRDHTPERARLDNPFHRVAWLYRAASVLAEQIANIPFLFTRGDRGREHLITSGPLHNFYDQPHPHINRFEYWELRVLWLLLRGECFRIPIYEAALAAPKSDVGGSRITQASPARTASHNDRSTLNSKYPQPSTRRLARVLILNPDHFHEVIEDHRLIGWRYTGLGSKLPLESQVFLPEEVWHDKLPDPFNFWRGLSPLCAADLPARADFAAGNFMRGVMENNGDLGLIVRTTDQLDDTQKEQLLAALRSRKNGAGVADKPLLLWNSCEIVKPTLSAADLQFLENRKFCRAEICAALGVPEEIVSSTDHNKYDVMQGARLNFIENRVAPLCARLEASERVTVKALDPAAVGWFDLDSLPIMQQARRSRLAAAKTGFDMGVPFNELNRMLDLGFPDLPHGSTSYLPSTLHVVGQSVPPPTAPVQSSKFEVQGSKLPFSACATAPVQGSNGQSGSDFDVRGSNGQSGSDFEVQSSKLPCSASSSSSNSASSSLAAPKSDEGGSAPSKNGTPASPQQILQLSRELHDLLRRV